ncbi:hypothetical protein RCL1_003623 [Eukaryota sp. TZLM3-RCL]
MQDDNTYCAFCLDTENIVGAKWVQLKCRHTFHSSCLTQWVNFSHDSCPLCCKKFSISEVFKTPIFRISNLAVSCQPNRDESELKPFGWCNVQLKVASALRGVKIKKVVYYFHPAFSQPYVKTGREYYDLVIKLCSTDVEILVNVHYRWMGCDHQFTFVHKVVKEPIVKTYIVDFANGTSDQTPIIPQTYWSEILDLYDKPSNYYEEPMQAPRRGFFKLFTWLTS